MEGAQEPTAFLQWQKEMREKDLQEEQTRIKRRHLEGLMSHKEAAIAPARMMERNQKAAQLQKEEVLLFFFFLKNFVWNNGELARSMFAIRWS